MVSVTATLLGPGLQGGVRSRVGRSPLASLCNPDRTWLVPETLGVDTAGHLACLLRTPGTGAGSMA